MVRQILGGLMLSAAAAAVAATPATFPGGQQALDTYLEENVRYPAIAQENGIEGTVTVNFTVNADGTLSAVQIARPLDPDLEAEALRLVKGMPAWTPATDDGGNAVAGTVTLPVKFRLRH